MSNIVTIKGQEIDLTDRKVQCETFGKQFKADATAYESLRCVMNVSKATRVT